MPEYRLRKDWIAVRELPAPPDSQIILQLDDPNKRRCTVITGRVEQVGPGRRNKAGELVPMDVQAGDLVYYEIEMGKARLPWDLEVRVMREGDVAAVLDIPAMSFKQYAAFYQQHPDWFIEQEMQLGREQVPRNVAAVDDSQSPNADRLIDYCERPDPQVWLKAEKEIATVSGMPEFTQTVCFTCDTNYRSSVKPECEINHHDFIEGYSRLPDDMLKGKTESYRDRLEPAYEVLARIERETCL